MSSGGASAGSAGASVGLATRSEILASLTRAETLRVLRGELARTLPPGTSPGSPLASPGTRTPDARTPGGHTPPRPRSVSPNRSLAGESVTGSYPGGPARAGTYATAPTASKMAVGRSTPSGAGTDTPRSAASVAPSVGSAARRTFSSAELKEMFADLPAMDEKTAAILARSAAVGGRRVRGYADARPDVKQFFPGVSGAASPGGRSGAASPSRMGGFARGVHGEAGGVVGLEGSATPLASAGLRSKRGRTESTDSTPSRPDSISFAAASLGTVKAGGVGSTGSSLAGKSHDLFASSMRADMYREGPPHPRWGGARTHSSRSRSRSPGRDVPTDAKPAFAKAPEPAPAATETDEDAVDPDALIPQNVHVFAVAEPGVAFLGDAALGTSAGIAVGALPASHTTSSYAFRHAAATSQHAHVGTVYDRLTDTRGFTGTHRLRFGPEGRGLGLVGRDTASDYVQDLKTYLPDSYIPPLATAGSFSSGSSGPLRPRSGR